MEESYIQGRKMSRGEELGNKKTTAIGGFLLVALTGFEPVFSA
jgi:hypothetical protein